MDPVPAMIPTRADIERLQAAVSRLPQIEFPTTHTFSPDGLYTREMHMPQGAVLIGKVHRERHVFILHKGRMLLTGDGVAAREVEAPLMLIGEPGVKRAGYALTDCICANVHIVDPGMGESDLPAIEARLIEPDEHAMLDIHNKPIKEVLPWSGE